MSAWRLIDSVPDHIWPPNLDGLVVRCFKRTNEPCSCNWATVEMLYPLEVTEGLRRLNRVAGVSICTV